MNPAYRRVPLAALPQLEVFLPPCRAVLPSLLADRLNRLAAVVDALVAAERFPERVEMDRRGVGGALDAPQGGVQFGFEPMAGHPKIGADHQPSSVFDQVDRPSLRLPVPNRLSVPLT